MLLSREHPRPTNFRTVRELTIEALLPCRHPHQEPHVPERVRQKYTENITPSQIVARSNDKSFEDTLFEAAKP